MPRQNRVTPFSEILADPARGTFMGNRGRLHDVEGRIVRSHAGICWIICLLSFKGRRRQVMKPGSYTELFFLDEATALAAGHRPCAECMRNRFVAFREAWTRGNPDLASPRLRAPELDAHLHGQRVAGSGQRTHRALLSRVPTGAFVREDAAAAPRLVLGESTLEWSFSGYRSREWIAGDREVEVLTPRSVVKALRAGYRPQLHPSAENTRHLR